jgi:hypothetical protein
MNFNPIKIHIYTYLFIILILILLFINNFIYLPQYEIKNSVLLAAKASFSKKDNLITVSQVNDRDIISLWLTESNVLSLIENKNCNKIKTEKYSKINIINVKNNNTLNMYVDGIFDKNVPSTIQNTFNPVDIIGASWSSYFSGSIAFLSISISSSLYTTQNIQQTFNAQKSRFGF